MKSPTRALYALVALLYLLAFPYHPRLRSPNELCRLWQTRALVDHGELHINQALRDHGRVGDLSVKDGRYYPSKAPLLSFAAVPLYAVLKAVGGGGTYAVPELPLVFFSRLLLTVLPTLLLLGLLRRFLRAYVEPSVADGVVATYALGSLAFSYSLLFMSHQTTAVLLFAAFFALWRSFRGEWGAWGFLVAGALVGAAVAAEYTGALGVLGLLAYGLTEVWRTPEPPRARALRALRIAGLATLGALPFVVGLMAYHQAAFGHPLDSGYKYLADAAYQPWHVGGFLGIRFPDPRAFWLSFFSPLRGFFTLAPFLLLSLPGLAILRNPWMRPSAKDAPALPTERGERGSRGLFALTATLLVAYAYFTSSFAYDSWGWTTGPRHLTPLVPFLLLPVALALSLARAAGGSPKARVLLGIGAGLCAASVLVTGLLTFVNYIPDDVSNALYALALPLLRDGYGVPSVPFLLGVPNPAAGVPLLLALLGAAGLTAFLLVRGLPPPLAPAQDEAATAPAAPGQATAGGELGALLGTAAVVVALHLALLGLTYARTPQDAGAQAFLRQVWLAPPGATVPFWPSR